MGIPTYLEAVDAGTPGLSYERYWDTPPIFDASVGPDGAWIAGRYGDSAQILDNPSFSNATTITPIRYKPSEAAAELMADMFQAPPSFATLDGEEHAAVQSEVLNSFNGVFNHVREVMPELLVGLVSALLVEQPLVGAATRGVELMGRFVNPLAAEVGRRTIGVLGMDSSTMSSLSRGVMESIWGANPTHESQVQSATDAITIWNYGKAAVTEAKAVRGSSPNNYITRALEQGVATDQIVSNIFTLLGAGYNAPTHGLGSVIRATLESEDGQDEIPSWRQLHDSPDQIRTAVRKGLKKYPPVIGWLRMAARPISVGGVSFEPGQRVIVLIDAANKAPDRPEGSEDLTFSTGPHKCIGMRQAYYFIGEGLERLTQRFPDARLLRCENELNLAFQGPRELYVDLGEPVGS